MKGKWRPKNVEPKFPEDLTIHRKDKIGLAVHPTNARGEPVPRGGHILFHVIVASNHLGNDTPEAANFRNEIIERIEACWNALVGVPTETILRYTDLGDIGGMIHQWEELREAKDEDAVS